jgi:hypothetical protein
MLKFLLLLNMLNENFTKARNKQSNLLNMLIFKISMLSLISIFGDFPDVYFACPKNFMRVCEHILFTWYRLRRDMHHATWPFLAPGPPPSSQYSKGLGLRSIIRASVSWS